MESTKWPKTIAPLTPEQKEINDDFMAHWHKQLPNSLKFKLVEFFNNGYPKWHAPTHFKTTLEVGAGLGEHIAQQTLSEEQQKNYVALELRENMAENIRSRFPLINTCIGDCQERLPFEDNYFDRILAIHVLEHLSNLPTAVKEMYRLINKEKGIFSVVIPCEGGWLYKTMRKVTSQRMFEKRYNTPYQFFIEREHVNMPHEIFEELSHYFNITHRMHYPALIPAVDVNILIGITLTPKPERDIIS